MKIIGKIGLQTKHPAKILLGIRKYGNEKLPNLLELCPDFDINTVVYDEDINLNYYKYLYDLEVDYYDDKGYPVEPLDRYHPENIKLDDDNILFTGSLIHYGILINDLELVEYLKSLGANVRLIIEGEDCTWDYVSSNSMSDLIEQAIGSKDLAGLTNEEKNIC